MEQLQILWVAKSRATAQGGVKPHTHPYYHMLYVENGICSMVVSGQLYTLEQGQCILIPPNTEHSYSNEEAVAMFLRDEIGFYDIYRRVGAAVEAVPFVKEPTLEQILESDWLAREAVKGQ